MGEKGRQAKMKRNNKNEKITPMTSYHMVENWKYTNIEIGEHRNMKRTNFLVHHFPTRTHLTFPFTSQAYVAFKSNGADFIIRTNS